MARNKKARQVVAKKNGKLVQVGKPVIIAERRVIVTPMDRFVAWIIFILTFFKLQPEKKVSAKATAKKAAKRAKKAARKAARKR